MSGCDRYSIVIDEISGSSVVNFDGALVVSPKTLTRSAYGAGSGNTAVFSFTFTDVSSTSTEVVDLFDRTVE